MHPLGDDRAGARPTVSVGQGTHAAPWALKVARGHGPPVVGEVEPGGHRCLRGRGMRRGGKNQGMWALPSDVCVCDVCVCVCVSMCECVLCV